MRYLVVWAPYKIENVWIVDEESKDAAIKRVRGGRDMRNLTALKVDSVYDGWSFVLW